MLQGQRHQEHERFTLPDHEPQILDVELPDRYLAKAEALRDECGISGLGRWRRYPLRLVEARLRRLLTSDRSRVEGDRSTDGIEPRSDFPDTSVDQTEALNSEIGF
jgi:hypothetical protein